MSDKNFKVKSGLQVPSLTTAGPVVTDNSGNVTSSATLPISQGGTGQTTAGNALNALLPLQTSQDNKYLQTNGINTQWTTVLQPIYSDNAPSTPQVGQVWIESDSTSDSFDPNIIRRKTITATAGQTTFTTDLEFIQGYEQVFFNGMLLLRTTDYTTPSNTSVVLASAAAAGDIVEILSITNLNSINTATTTTNTFTGDQTIQGTLNVSGPISSTASNAQSAHIDGSGYGYRIRANTSNSAGSLQFTNNAASTDWAYINASAQNSLVIRTTTGATSPGNYAWLGINGGPVQIRDITAAGGEASDWPVPSLSIASFDDYTHNTMLGFLLKDDDNYILDYSKWNIKISDTGSKTTSASTTNLHFGGPGAMILYTGNAESARLEVGGALRAKYHTGLTTSPNRFTLATGAGYFNTGWAGGLFLFHGYIAGNEFWDLVINQLYGSINVISSATIGSPPTRTYASPSGGTLGVQLTGGTSGTYTIDLNWITAG